MKRLILALACVLVWSGQASAQVTFDAATSGTGAGASISFAHTTTSSADRVIYAFVSIDAAADFSPACTYNSVALTQIAEVSTNRYISLHRLVAPATGSNTMDCSSLPGGGNQAVIVYTLSGVDQATPEDTPITGNAATGTSISQDVTSASGDLVIDGTALNQTITSLAAGAGQTQPTNGEQNQASMWSATSYEAGAGTTNMAWSWTTNAAHAWIAANVNAASGGSVTVCRGMLLGVGCDE